MNSYEEIRQFIESKIIGKKSSSYPRIFEKYSEVKEYIEQYVSYLESGDSFNKFLYCYLNGITSHPTCKRCDNKVSFRSFGSGFLEFCSNKCSNEFFKETGEGIERAKKANKTKEKIGEDGLTGFQRNGKNTRETNIKKDNYKNVITKKRIATLMEVREDGMTGFKYIGKKIKETRLSKSGNDYSKSKRKSDLKNKIQNYYLLKDLCDYYKVTSIVSEQEYIERYNTQTMIDFKCEKCLKKFSTRQESFLGCPWCDKKSNRTSRYEAMLYDIISEKGILVELNKRRIISPYEIDVYLPTKNIGIEIDGLMYHSFGKHSSSIFNNFEKENTNKYKHLWKTEKCADKGIRLYHIFENELLNENKKNIWFSIIGTFLGESKSIYARKCEIIEINSKEKDDFLEQNHLQGRDKSSVKLALKYNKVIVSVMTFCKSRYNKDVQWEISRFCNKCNLVVVGGASRLLKFFEKKYRPISIITYADRRISNGAVYEKLGFTFSHFSKPNYFYFKPNENILYSRVKFQKHKLEGILERFDKNLTETENMYNNSYRRIWDCGNYVFKKRYV